MTPVTPWWVYQRIETIENGLNGLYLTRKVDTKCSDVNLSRSGATLEQNVQIWWYICP